jgi:Domain of unknown function (DUF4129)
MNNIKTLVISILVIGQLFVGNAIAQKSDSVAQKSITKKVIFQKDNTPLVVRKPTDARLKDYQNNRDYRYDRDYVTPQNPLAKFWNWFTDKLFEFFRSKSYQDVWQYVILAALVGLTIWLLIKSGFLGNMFVGKTIKSDELNYELLTENIHELNFADLIAEATTQRNYRLAVRLYYLKTLKQLSDKNLINWQPTKTNRLYLYELTQKNLKPDFEGIIRQFEYVWYGEFTVSEADFKEISDDFSVFSDKILQI